MELREYLIMRSLEEKYWWYVGLRDLSLTLVGRYYDLAAAVMAQSAVNQGHQE